MRYPQQRNAGSETARPEERRRMFHTGFGDGAKGSALKYPHDQDYSQAYLAGCEAKRSYMDRIVSQENLPAADILRLQSAPAPATKPSETTGSLWNATASPLPPESFPDPEMLRSILEQHKDKIPDLIAAERARIEPLSGPVTAAMLNEPISCKLVEE